MTQDVMASFALKDLFFEKIKGCVIKLNRGEDAVGVEPGLKSSIDAIEVKKRHPLIHLKDICMIKAKVSGRSCNLSVPKISVFGTHLYITFKIKPL
jgi:hypothetical protein